ncbi:twinkle mtDNA helicase-like [Patella vulgata]|uniref:twinkle mtDNA helicase-like n=1 Tax=Patella vulgata TaxID=6465 RepID=UPI0021800388|nr:twinkle mtDNA helicase-like [Patella vulgata]
MALKYLYLKMVLTLPNNNLRQSLLTWNKHGQCDKNKIRRTLKIFDACLSYPVTTSRLSGSDFQPIYLSLPTTIFGRQFTKNVEIQEEEVLTTPMIQKYLVEKGMKFEQGHACFVTMCPKVAKMKQIKNTDSERLFINMTTGHFVCHFCGKIGSWNNLVDNVLYLMENKRKKSVECFHSIESVQSINDEPSVVTTGWKSTVPFNSLPSNDRQEIVQDFDYSKIQLSTFEKYQVQYDSTTRTMVFPYHNINNLRVGLKKITCKKEDNEFDVITISLKESFLPRTSPRGLFGWNMINDDTSEIVLTNSEVDAMAVFQDTKIAALALPKGYNVLPQEILPCLERFKRIIIWFGEDIRAWEAAKQFAKKLNNKRCYIIRPSADDPGPYKALKQGIKLLHILSKGKPMNHKSITVFSQLRQEVFSELAHIDQVSGVKWKRYTALNKILKGHRRGELTVFTGSTGSGKTTFISDYSLDLAIQGVNTLWGSFEISNIRLTKMLLTQFAQMNLSKNLDQFDYWANKIEELPMYFMTFHGHESIKRVIDTMGHAVYVHDIAHVVVDNLQFMMGSQGDYADRFNKQDQIVAAFRKFATQMNCHVTLVIHPRKEKDSEELTTASVFGSAKATQEADNVLILQDKRMMSLRGRKYLQITKNRFDGELGVMVLKFDPESLTFSVNEKQKKGEQKEITEKPDDTNVIV